MRRVSGAELVREIGRRKVRGAIGEECITDFACVGGVGASHVHIDVRFVSEPSDYAMLADNTTESRASANDFVAPYRMDHCLPRVVRVEVVVLIPKAASNVGCGSDVWKRCILRDSEYGNNRDTSVRDMHANLSESRTSPAVHTRLPSVSRPENQIFVKLMCNSHLSTYQP